MKRSTAAMIVPQWVLTGFESEFGAVTFVDGGGDNYFSGPVAEPAVGALVERVAGFVVELPAVVVAVPVATGFVAVVLRIVLVVVVAAAAAVAGPAASSSHCYRLLLRLLLRALFSFGSELLNRGP